jgi:hypothetical protein
VGVREKALFVTLYVIATENSSVTCRTSFSVNCEKEHLKQKEFFEGKVKISFIVGSIFIFPPQEIISYYLMHKMSQIWGESGGKVNILGGDRICHFKEKNSYEHLSNSERLVR